jgi:hypothetical protein
MRIYLFLSLWLIYFSCAARPHNLEGMALSLDTLERLKKGEEVQFGHKNVSSTQVKKALFWYQELPTIGLRPTDQFFPPTYPFIPHQFTLWQLAPLRGKGVRIAVIDSGIAAFEVEGDPSYQKNIDLPDVTPPGSVLNVSNPQLSQLVAKIKPFLRSAGLKLVDQEAGAWVTAVLNKQNSALIEKFLCSHGKSSVVDGGQLTPRGKKLVAELSAFITSHFSTIYVAGSDEPIVAQFLPVARAQGKGVFAAGHGSHMVGIIAGKVDDGNEFAPVEDEGICGLAPEAEVVMIKAFEGGTSNKKSLTTALETARKMNAEIVNLSLKISHDPQPSNETKKLMQQLMLTPYVVVASGNAQHDDLISRLPYPARFGGLIDVGAFKYDDVGNYPLAGSSQYESRIGPKFVAPGYNILSSGLIPEQSADSMYVFMGGTSPAAAVMTAELALLISEFGKFFTRDQILQVMAMSAVHMHNDATWNKRSLFGTLDVRLALFTLHVVRFLKQQKEEIPLRFRQLIVKIHTKLFEPVEQWAKIHNVRAALKTDFANFIRQSERAGERFVGERLEEAVARVGHSVQSMYK